MLSVTDAQVHAAIAALLWPFVRTLALIQTAPVFGHRAVPQRVKIGLALLISLLVAPGIPAQPVDAFSAAGMLLLLQQIIVGAAMGFGLRAVFAAFELAGDLVGLQMGLGFASFLDPQRGAPSPLLGTFFMLCAMLAFLSTDGHLTLLLALGESFRIIPISPHPLDNLDWMRLADLGAVMFASGLQIALPVLAAILSINIALGFVSRSAPQLNIFNLGFAVTLLAGLAVLWLTLSVLSGPTERIVGIAVPYFKSAVVP
ncbi:Flagellar biosynthetic protein FliR [Pigmentiphaga humi]|uniref:Flagellar biosynthetic protein FliR n=1 Tax=Pigmentiphaga humi TaxID=2478468 RepID=A0A3P4B471_9BURK|nr:flagellar biosynthetic protein FliR [Pigmentiphaga humi]VCU69945.1 Flagellar biosynthetic protein FliR [Pigmentiphaga humi]